jgi:hypothetical protein
MSLEALGMKLSLPFNFEADFVETVLEPCPQRVDSVYLAMPWPDCTTVRPWSGGGSMKDYLDRVQSLYGHLVRHGIHLHFTANQRVTPREARAVTDRAVDLFARFPASRFVFASLPLAQRVKAAIPEADIGPSTVAQVRSPISAWYWQEAVGARTMVLAREVNRRLDLVREFRRMGYRLTVIPVDGCIAECTSRAEHESATAIADMVAELGFDTIGMTGCQPFSRSCRESPAWTASIARMTVMPGQLHHLEGLVDTVKIAGREMKSWKIKAIVDSYLDATAFEMHIDNRLYIEEPPEAWERLAGCDEACWRCTWCRDHIVRKTEPSSEPLLRISRRQSSGETPSAAQPAETPASAASPSPAAASPAAVGPDPASAPEAASLPAIALHLVPADPGLRELCVRNLASGTSFYVRTGVFGLSYDGASLPDVQGETIRRLSEFLRTCEASDPDLTLDHLAASGLLAAAFADYRIDVERFVPGR